MPVCFIRLKHWVMKSVILASWDAVEWCLRKPDCSGGRLWFWWIQEFSLWATTRSSSLLTVLKRINGLWEQGSDDGLPGYRMGIMLADSQEEEKYPNPRIWLKTWVMWMRALRKRFRSKVAEMPSVPGADLVLGDWIIRRRHMGLWAEP